MYREQFANSLWQFACRHRERALRKALARVSVTQERVLKKIIGMNTGTVFGQRYRFDKIATPEQFQQEVPVSCYEDYLPYLNRIRSGEKRVLTTQPVHHLHLSSGTSSPSKLLPFTAELKREFGRGVAPWLSDLFRNVPEIKLGKGYWALSPNDKREESRESGLSIGFDQDEEYFSWLEARFMQAVMAVPPEVGRIRDNENFFYVTLLFLLATRELSWVSLWNPSYFELLLGSFGGNRQRLVEDLRYGRISPPGAIQEELRLKLERKLSASPMRALEIERFSREFLDHCPWEFWSRIWPRLALISCWTDAWAGLSLPRIRSLFPHVTIQGKGLLATEGIVSIPLHDRRGVPLAAPVLAVNSHFFEFRCTESRRVFLANELERGRTYEVILTTSGGLYRYQLNDLVRVKGFCREAPCLTFIGKAEMISDICGEKLHETHVQEVLQSCFQKHEIVSSFYFVAPDTEHERLCYVLYVELPEQVNNSEEVLLHLDTALCENYHYAYCRRLGQLGPPLMYSLEREAKELYLKEKHENSRVAVLKTLRLERTANWWKHLPGEFIGRKRCPVATT